MAGLGQRFRDAGYSLPKPLIPVDGEPMVVRVVRDLPAAARIVFIVHPEHVAQFAIDRVLRDKLPQAEIVVAPGLTEGQACSVRLGTHLLDPRDEVIVAACDNTHRYQLDQLRRQTATRDVDCLIWTYRGVPRVLENPHWYGWVQTNAAGDVTNVSVKKPISANPLADHVVSGTFWFRSAEILANGIDSLVASNIRVNNEFYLDAVPNLLRDQGRRSQVFEVDEYIGWGTPADLVAYEAARAAA